MEFGKIERQIEIDAAPATVFEVIWDRFLPRLATYAPTARVSS